MKQSWTKGITKESATELRQNFKEALVMRRRLVSLLKEKVNTSDAQSRSKLLYDNPNWALLQADQRGYERALEEVIDLIFEDC